MKALLNKIIIVSHIGTEPGIDTLITMQNKHRQNVAILKKTDLEDIEPVKLQKMLDILHDEYECDDCERKENAIEKLRDEVYDFSLELHKLVSMVEDNMIEGNTSEEAKKATGLIAKLRKHKLANHKEFDMDF